MLLTHKPYIDKINVFNTQTEVNIFVMLLSTNLCIQLGMCTHVNDMILWLIQMHLKHAPHSVCQNYYNHYIISYIIMVNSRCK